MLLLLSTGSAAETTVTVVLMTVSLARMLVVLLSVTGFKTAAMTFVDEVSAEASAVLEVVLDAFSKAVVAAGVVFVKVEALEVEVVSVEAEPVWEMLGTRVVEELALLVTVTLLVLNE